jgi:hypothetical protein
MYWEGADIYTDALDYMAMDYLLLLALMAKGIKACKLMSPFCRDSMPVIG